MQTTLDSGLRLLLLGVLLGAASCSHEHPQAGVEPQHAAAEHVHTAPRGGLLLVLEHETAHAEVLLDRNAATLDLYLLDGHAEHAIRSAQPTLTLRFADGERVVLAAVASPLTGESVGDSSRFRAAHPRFSGTAAFDALLERVEVRGATYTEVAVPYPGSSQDAHDAH